MSLRINFVGMIYIIISLKVYNETDESKRKNYSRYPQLINQLILILA